MKRTTASTNTEFAHQLRRDSWWVIFWLFLCVMLLSYFKPIQPLERLNNVIYDFQQRLHPFTVDKEELPFALIIIDDKSLKSLGHWPWRRSIYAELLSHLKEAEVVGIDLLFTNTNPAYPEDDEQLAQAIKEHGRVILPIYIDQENKIEEPITPLLNAAAGVGFINIHPDADGVVRHIRLFHDLNKKKPLERPSLWRMTGTRTQGVSVNSKDTTYPNENQLNHSVVPHFSTALVSITEDAPILESYDLHYLNPHLSPFIGPLGSFNTYPFSKVLAGDYPSEAFKGKYVLIGAWGSGLGDYYPTPFSSADTTSMSGVEILANATNNVLNRHWIHKVPNWVKALANALPVLFICIALRHLSPRLAFFGTSLVVLAIFIGNWFLLHFYHLWIPIGSALMGTVISYPLWYWRTQETVLRYVDKQLNIIRKHNPGLSQTLDISRVQLTLPERLSYLYKTIELLREAEQRREETLNFISHDMRAPQNSILALVEVQRQDHSNIDQEVFFQRLEHYAHNTLNLVDDFLDLARVESSAFEVQPVVLNDLVNQAMDDCWANATKKHIKLNYKESDQTIWVEVHSPFISRALVNLIDNAIKYSPEYTTIFCSLSVRKDKAMIQIKDQGWGIPKEELPNIFNAFKRLHTDKPKNPKGTGLGLAFVHTVIERHRGTIEVTSTVNKGTTFTIYLPLMRADYH